MIIILGCKMIKSITIANRDDGCQDCKLTAKRVIERKPSLWQRLWHKTEPYIEIKVEVWYGRSAWWKPMGFSRQINACETWMFDRVWGLHCEEKKRQSVRGPFRTTFTMKDGQWVLRDSTR